MRQRASGTVNPEMKKQANIYMFSQIFCFLLLLYKCQKRISWSCPSRFRFRTSPWYLMVVLLPSWWKNKCRALPIITVFLIHVTFSGLLHKLNVWWHHQMETFYLLLALCEGNPPLTSGFPSQRPVTRRSDVFFDLCLNKQWSKQLRPPGDLRCCQAHYDITVMDWPIISEVSLKDMG